MNITRALSLLLLGLLLTTGATYACSGTCCGVSESYSNLSIGEAIGTGVDAVTTGIKFTTETTCLVIHETPKQIAAIPDAIHTHMNGARASAGSFFDRSVNLLATASHAVINFSASLLRILFASFLARA